MVDDPWLQQLFERIDAGGVLGIFDELHEDVRFRFGSFPPGEGRQVFADLWAGLSSTVTSLSHELEESWRTGDTVICSGQVTYGRPDGSSARFPFTNVLKLADGRIRDYRIYVDASPVFGLPPLP